MHQNTVTSKTIPFCYGAGSWLMLAGTIEAFAVLFEQDLSAEALFVGLIALPILVCFFTNFYTSLAYMLGSAFFAPIAIGVDNFVFYIFVSAIFFQISVWATNILYYAGLKDFSEIFDIFENKK